MRGTVRRVPTKVTNLLKLMTLGELRPPAILSSIANPNKNYSERQNKFDIHYNFDFNCLAHSLTNVRYVRLGK